MACLRIRRRPVCLDGMRQEAKEVRKTWVTRGPITGGLEAVAKSSFVYQMDGEGNDKI